MISANEAHEIACASFESRRRPQIEAEWNKRIEQEARAGRRQTESYVRPRVKDHIDLIIKVLKENGYRVVVRQPNTSEYIVEAHW